MNGNQRAMYTGLAMSRSAEIQMRWMRSLFFLTIHSAIISFLASRTESQRTFGLQLFVCFLGLFIGVAWGGTIWRTNKRVRYWQSRLRVFEETQFGIEDGDTSVFSGQEWREMEGSLFSFSNVTMGLAGLFILGWLVVFIATLVKS